MSAALNFAAGAQEQFMLPVTNDADVWPRYRVGEFIVIAPGAEAQLGDDVVVTLHDGRCQLRELVDIDDSDAITLEDNAGTLLVFAPAAVAQVVPVVGRMSRAMAQQHMPGAEVFRHG